jgi:hypothetical protein
VSVLHLTDLWQMPHARADAITALFELLVDPAEKLVISDRYHITAWTELALEQLVDRDHPLSVADIERIGIPRAAKVAARREEILIQPRGFTYDIHCTCDVPFKGTPSILNEHRRDAYLSLPPCMGCGSKSLQCTLCRKCQAMRCSTCRSEVGVAENEIKRAKVPRSTVGWAYDELKAWAVPIGLSVLVIGGYKRWRR